MSVRKDKLRTDHDAIKKFIVENVTYESRTGTLYLRGAGVKIPIETDEENGKKPRVRIGGLPVLAAHVAFICKKGDWPQYPIRHLNGNEADIRWSNLIAVREAGDEEEEAALRAIGNDRFLADLRKHHPLGPPTFVIKSGKPVLIHSYRAPVGLGGSPAGMCADTI